MTQSALKIATELFDYGAHIGVVVEYRGERRAIRVPNPFAAEMAADWKAANPAKASQ